MMHGPLNAKLHYSLPADSLLSLGEAEERWKYVHQTQAVWALNRLLESRL